MSGKFPLLAWIVSLLVLLTPLVVIAQNFSNGFNFNLPGNDGSDQRFLPTFPANEIKDFIHIDDGHFVSGGDPIKFWGVNLTTHACFPLKEKSPFIASRMRKMGINLVRFHHMDNGWSNDDGTLFIRSTGNTRDLNPTTLDRLFFLLSEMKKNNIYANINLHVSRTFLEGDGVENADSLWQFAKGVTYFDPQLISLQKEFARKLLTAENPYTGLALNEDPVIAMVEITNENTLYGMWKGDQLKRFAEGGSLMHRHDLMLNELWSDFLLNKYQDFSQLESAWQISDANSMATNQMTDGNFEANDINSNWDLELHNTASATMEVSDDNAFEGNFSAKITVTNVTGTAWHIQFQQDDLSMEKDSNYVLEFFARADRKRRINATLQRDVDPWTWYGGQNFELTTEWRKYRLSVTAIETNQGLVRATFNFANEPGVVWFDQVSFSKPVLVGLVPGEHLSDRNIRRIDYSERLAFHPQRVADLAQFYLNIQRDYYRDMYAFLKGDLQINVPITGTNALVGPADVFIQQDLDYIDDHAYWNHPRFPNEPWSSTDWFINNESLLDENRMGTIADLFGGLALEGKPYTISEYNHPFPNRYHWEMFPVLASHASYHDADGLMFFSYHGGSNSDWESDFISDFFGIHRNHSLMSMSPIFGYAYRVGLIDPASDKKLIQYDSSSLFHMPLQDNFGRWGTYYPYDQLGSANVALRTLGFSSSEMSIPPLDIAPNAIFTTGNQQLQWNANTRLHTINASQLQVFTGNLGSVQDATLDALTLHHCSDEGVVSWLSLDGAPLPSSQRSLLSLHSRIQNSNMVWVQDETVRDQWGSSPTEILALKVQLGLDIEADSLHIYPLNELGAEVDYFTLLPANDGGFMLEIDQQEFTTPWFGIEAFGITTSIDQQNLDNVQLQLWPNPTSESFNLTWGPSFQPKEIRLINHLGQCTKQLIVPLNSRPGIEIKIPDMAPGTYFIQLISDDKMYTKKLVKN